MGFLPKRGYGLLEFRLYQPDPLETHQKLQQYADIIASLYEELRSLKANICATCKEKFVPGSPGTSEHDKDQFHPTGSRVPPKAVPLMLSKSWHRLFKKHRHTASLPINATDLQSSPISPGSSESISFQNSETFLLVDLDNTVAAASEGHSWSIKRRPLVNAALDFIFAHSFSFQNKVQSVCFSADGRYLAVAQGVDDDGSVVIFEVKTRQIFCKLIENSSQYSTVRRPAIASMSFSPNGKYIITGDMAFRVIVWDIQNRRICSISLSLTHAVKKLHLSPNGRLVTYISGSDVRVANLRDGAIKSYSDDDGGYFFSVRFSQNGKYVVAGNAIGTLRIWDVRTGRLVKKWAGHRKFIWNLRFTKDGKGLLSADNDGVVKYWDVGFLNVARFDAEPILLREFKGHTKSVPCISVSPNDRFFASTSNDQTGILWDIESGERQCTVGYSHSIWNTEFSPAGTDLAMCSDRYVSLWKYYQRN